MKDLSEDADEDLQHAQVIERRCEGRKEYRNWLDLEDENETD
jgi:hypothetical protein